MADTWTCPNCEQEVPESLNDCLCGFHRAIIGYAISPDKLLLTFSDTYSAADAAWAVILGYQEDEHEHTDDTPDGEEGE